MILISQKRLLCRSNPDNNFVVNNLIKWHMCFFLWYYTIYTGNFLNIFFNFNKFIFRRMTTWTIPKLIQIFKKSNWFDIIIRISYIRAIHIRTIHTVVF